MLYHPDADYNYIQMVREMQIQLCMPRNPEENMILSDDIPSKSLACIQFWGGKMQLKKQEISLLPEVGNLPMTADGSRSPKKSSFFSLISNAVLNRSSR